MTTPRIYEKHKAAADEAYAIFVSYCGGVAPSRVPGMDTVIGLAHRLNHGMTIEETAAREYVYRWNLAVKEPDQCFSDSVRNAPVSIFGTPHTLGM